MLLFFKKLPKYFLFQIFGWGLFLAVNVFFAISYKMADRIFFIRLVVTMTLGCLFTHIMRMVIKRIPLLKKRINHQLIGFVLLSIIFALLVGIVETLVVKTFQLSFKQENRFNLFQEYISNAFSWIVFLFIWNCIYFIYHFIDESTKNKMDKLKLEALVKSLELKTIKSHINPHFIFNALNSIRALIDENPIHARGAITALSNILRSSMVSETQETISLERELNIVKDYLALELMRFEDRLTIKYEIPENVLHFQIPPMMLQTLVENAIKHGISKSLKSGEILIQAAQNEQVLQLIVMNTGKLVLTEKGEGFGLQGTESRLNLIFGNQSKFSISQKDKDYVEACVIIPVS